MSTPMNGDDFHKTQSEDDGRTRRGCLGNCGHFARKNVKFNLIQRGISKLFGYYGWLLGYVPWLCLLVMFVVAGLSMYGLKFLAIAPTDVKMFLPMDSELDVQHHLSLDFQRERASSCNTNPPETRTKRHATPHVKQHPKEGLLKSNMTRKKRDINSDREEKTKAGLAYLKKRGLKSCSSQAAKKLTKKKEVSTKGETCHTLHYVLKATDDTSLFENGRRFEAVLMLEKLFYGFTIDDAQGITYGLLDRCPRKVDNPELCALNYLQGLMGTDGSHMNEELLSFFEIKYPYYEKEYFAQMVGGESRFLAFGANLQVLYDKETGSFEGASAIRFMVDYCNGNEVEALRKDWEGKVIDYMEEMRECFEVVHQITIAYYFLARSEAEIMATVMSLLDRMILTTVLLILFVMVASLQFDAVRSKAWLGLIGIFSTLLASASGIGLVLYFWRDTTPFITMIATIPFLILAIGLDDMFVLLSGWRRTNPRDTTANRMQQVMEESGTAVFMTFVTNLTAAIIGQYTPFRAIQIFSTYNFICMIYDFVFQTTIFGSCIAIFGIAEGSSHHSCLCCLHVETRETLLEEDPDVSDLKLICCAGGVPEHAVGEEEDDTQLVRLVRDIFGRNMLRVQVRPFFVLLYVAYISVSCYGVLNVIPGLKEENLFNFDSPSARFLRMTVDSFLRTSRVHIQINRPDLDYYDSKTQREILQIFEQLEESELFEGPEFTSFWLRDYLNWLEKEKRHIRSRDEFYEVLQKEFFTSGTASHYESAFTTPSDTARKNDTMIRFCYVNGNLSVVLSEGLVVGSRLAGERQRLRDIELLEAVLALPEKYKEYQVTVWNNQDFRTYEHFATIVPLTLYNIGIALSASLLVSIFMIPHLTSIFWVMISLSSCVVGIVGMATLWNVTLDSISLPVFIIAVGYSLDFIMHFNYAYLVAKSAKRKERALEALGDVGSAVLPAGTGTVLSLIAMAAADNYLFTTFFKVLLLAVVLSATHACIFLPVFLCYLGAEPSEEDIQKIAAKNWENKAVQLKMNNSVELKLNNEYASKTTVTDNDTVYDLPVRQPVPSEQLYPDVVMTGQRRERRTTPTEELRVVRELLGLVCDRVDSLTPRSLDSANMEVRQRSESLLRPRRASTDSSRGVSTHQFERRQPLMSTGAVVDSDIESRKVQGAERARVPPGSGSVEVQGHRKPRSTQGHATARGHVTGRSHVTGRDHVTDEGHETTLEEGVRRGGDGRRVTSRRSRAAASSAAPSTATLFELLGRKAEPRPSKAN